MFRWNQYVPVSCILYSMKAISKANPSLGKMHCHIYEKCKKQNKTV